MTGQRGRGEPFEGVPATGPTLKPTGRCRVAVGCPARLTDGAVSGTARTHGAAFEMREALRVSAEALDAIVKRPPGDPDLSRRAHAAARDAILKARP